MRKYVFIKDEAYSSNLYTNFTEYLAKDGELKCSFGGAANYKLKLLEGEEARGLMGNHPMMLDTKHINNEHQNEIALVSFGGCVYEIPMGNLIAKASAHGSATLASFHDSTSEADLLAHAELYSPYELKKMKGLGFIYLTLVHLKDTDVYYMILNPTLVQCAGHIEIEGDPWIEHVKGIKDTIKDLIFTMEVTPQKIGNHIISGGLCLIDVLKDSIIQPEDREEFFGQLKLELSHIDKDVSHITSKEGMTGGAAISVCHGVDTPLIIEVKNELLGDCINEKEKLKWEYIISSLNG